MYVYECVSKWRWHKQTETTLSSANCHALQARCMLHDAAKQQKYKKKIKHKHTHRADELC